MATLISVEGPAFTGKTSLIIPTIKNILARIGIRTEYGHEPGDSVEAIALKNHIYQKAADGATQLELAQLFNKSRALHLTQKVIPFLQKDGLFLMDRFAPSTLVFQGIEGGVPIDQLLQLEVKTIGKYIPNLYLIVCFPQDTFDEVLNARRTVSNSDATRTSGGDGQTVWHKANDEKQKKRHLAYLKLPEIYRENNLNRQFVFIDASKHPVDVAKECLASIIPYLSKPEMRGVNDVTLKESLFQEFDRYYQEGNLSSIEDSWEKQQEIRREYLATTLTSASFR